MKGPQKRGPEAYRQLAERFREAARKVSAERERVRLLAMAKKWDVVADYLDEGPSKGRCYWRLRRQVERAGIMKSNAKRALLTGALLLVWSSAQALPLTYDIDISDFA